jgi:hypothetical protein
MSGDGVEGLSSKKWKYHDYRARHRFCKVVRVDVANLKEKLFADIISSTVALITVLFEDVIESVNIHKTLIDCDDAHDPCPYVTLMNTTETPDGFVFEGGIIQSTPKGIVEVVRGMLCLWLPGILQNFPLYFG